jgi:hypothetical protein
VAILFALSFGLAKEIRDWILNPWGMNPQALMSDCISDMWHNMVGVVLGFLSTKSILKPSMFNRGIKNCR